MKPMPGNANVVTATVFSILLAIPPTVFAQSAAPPEAQAWIDIATFSGMGMPMGGMGGNPMSALGGMFGGGRQAPQPGQGENSGRADQIFPPGFDPSSLQAGLDTLGKMLNPGGASAQQGSAQQPGLQDILGQILGGRR